MKKSIVPVLITALALTACGGSGESGSDSTAAGRTKNAALPTTTVAALRPPVTTMPPIVNTTKILTTTVPPTTQAPTPVTGPNTCSAKGPCKVGQTGPAGGTVFYVAASPQSWGQYMEVRPEAFETLAYDTCNLDAYSSYAAGKIGDGITQMTAVIAACAKDGKPSAAGSYARVNAYSQNGFGGWFIPSKDELQALADSRVVNFDVTKDLTSGTWSSKPTNAGSRGFDVVYGVKKETLAGTSALSRNGTLRPVELMSDGSQSYGNPNNRWGLIYIMRAFGPKA